MKGPTAAEAEPDAFLQKHVAFPLSGENQPAWLASNNMVRQYATYISGQPYLLGLICHKDKQVASKYVVEWESTSLSMTSLSHAELLQGIAMASKLKSEERKNEEWMESKLKENILFSLTAVTDEHEREQILDSESDEEDDDERVAEVNDDVLFIHMREDKEVWLDIEGLTLDDNPAMEEEQKEDNKEAEREQGLRWEYGQRLDPPLSASSGEVTKIKDECKVRFSNPLSSFFSFLPLEFWKVYMFHTNQYATKKYAAQRARIDINFRRVWKSVMLQEFMQFFSILMHMCLYPCPGQTYTACWHDARRHPYTMMMKVSRFMEIRSVLHMSAVGAPEQESDDALYKVRPIVNVLKTTLGAYLLVGSNIVIDESSMPCRSQYGRHLIYYNLSKPNGKYHFRFYLCCGADFYNCIRFRVKTHQGSDRGDGFVDMENEEDEDEHPAATVDICQDLMKPYVGSDRVLNTDNWYSSPLLCMEMKKKGIFVRGTCREGREHFPKGVVYTQAEANKAGWGAMRVVVNKKEGMYVPLDGWTVNPSTF